MSIFNARSMTEATLQLKPPSLFFLKRFFSNAPKFHDAMLVEIDVFKGKRKVVPYSRFGTAATPFEREAFKRQPFTIPYLKASRSLETAQALSVMPGEHVYSGKSGKQRALEQIGLDLVEVNDGIARTEDLQCARALLNGKSIIKGEEVDAEIDFGRSSTNTYTLSAADLWTAATSDPEKIFRDARREALKASGITTDICIMGQEALNAFFANDRVLRQLDNRNGYFGSVSADESPIEGAIYYGHFAGHEVWGLDEWVLDEVTNTETPIVPVDRIYVTSSRARNRMHYGPISHMGVLSPLSRFVETWLQNNPSVQMMAMHSAPLAVPHDIDATVSIKVV
jgi:Phage major capsid protein E